METPKQEYPRMQLKRELWQNLNGEWDFEFDDENVGIKEKWYKKESFSKKIIVPFAYQTINSQIDDKTSHEYVWYMKQFTIPKAFEGNNIILNFEAVDYKCVVYLNNEMICEHVGGHIGFSVDITNYLSELNKLVVYVYDPSSDETIPRGKQFWEEESRGIWYTKTTGIWQTVWIEPVPKFYIKQVIMTPDIDLGNINVELRFNDSANNSNLLTIIKFKDEIIQSCYFDIKDNFIKFSLDVFGKKIFRTAFHDDGYCWSPENPNLFDIFFKLSGEGFVDSVTSYFGMRKIHAEDELIFLNNKPYFQKLVLDQGYWSESLLTAPTDESLIDDITIAKKMGFNGCRKHQKVEEQRFLYWADKLGFLVWGEMPSGISYDDNYVKSITNEWIEVIKRDYNHPCIVTWVPLNESWGIPHVSRKIDQQSHSMSMYYLTKSLDDTRLVISNDGWEMTATDICAIHNYNHGGVDEYEKQKYFETSLKNKNTILNDMPAGRNIYCNGFEVNYNPIMLTEFGGISFDTNKTKDWGYTNVTSEDIFYTEYERLINCIANSEAIVGFCYTQLTDVEFEVNGLLTYERKLKFDTNKINKINNKYFNITRKRI